MLRDDFNVRKKGRELIFIAKKIYSCFYHTAFLESYYVYNIVPRGLQKNALYKNIVDWFYRIVEKHIT